jgi:hypothetical protein
VAGNNFNIAQVKLNGVAYGTKPGASINLGGLNHEPDWADGKMEGFLATPTHCEITCSFQARSDTDFEAIRLFTGIAEFVMLDLPGKPTYSSADAKVAETISIQPGEGITVRIIGKPAEKTN